MDADADAPNLHLVLGTGERWDWEEPYSDAMVAEIVPERCTGCGVCREVCPYGAVYVEDGSYRINRVICEGCLTCTLACPEKGAIRRRRVESGRIMGVSTPYGFPLVSASLNPGRPNSGKLVTEEKARARRMGPEIVVVDSAAGIGCQVVSSLAGADAAFLVVEPTPASFGALRRVLKLTRHFSQPAGVLINKVDMNPGFSDEIREFARGENLDLVGEVPYDDAVPRSMALMRPVFEVFPDSPASKALIEAAERVADILEDWEGWYARFRPRRPEHYVPIIIKPEGFG